MAVPLARYKVRRDKERQLTTRCARCARQSTIIRTPHLAGKIEVKLGTEGYPETLDQLVDGVKLLQDAQGKKIKFLRASAPRSHDQLTRLGLSAACRTTRRRRAGDGRNFRRLYQEHGPRARRNPLCGVVTENAC